MKMEIWWHEDCLKNRQMNAERQMKYVAEEMERVKQFIRDNVFYASQIEEAKRKKKTGFDREKFGRKKFNAETNTSS